MRHHAARDEGALTELVAFREALYGCFGRRRDALFEVVDALLGAGTLGGSGGAWPSLAHLSLAPGHRRGWGSVSAALRRGVVDGEAVQRLLVRQLVLDGAATGPLDFAVDVSVWPRRDATTSPERGYWYHPAGDRGTLRLPVVEGWAYQWVPRRGVLGRTRRSGIDPVRWTGQTVGRRVPGRTFTKP